jgi:hypothetical protein
MVPPSPPLLLDEPPLPELLDAAPELLDEDPPPLLELELPELLELELPLLPLVLLEPEELPLLDPLPLDVELLVPELLPELPLELEAVGPLSSVPPPGEGLEHAAIGTPADSRQTTTRTVPRLNLGSRAVHISRCSTGHAGRGIRNSTDSAPARLGGRSWTGARSLAPRLRGARPQGARNPMSTEERRSDSGHLLRRSLTGLIFVTSTALLCCGSSSPSSASASSSSPIDLLRDPAVKAALQAIAAQPTDPSNVTVSQCSVAAQAFADLGVWTNAIAPPNLVGTWNWTNCTSEEADTAPSLSSCSDSITWSSQSDGQITQENVGGVSQGMGTVGAIEGFAGCDAVDGLRGAWIIQSNEASGAGCSQQVLNLISVCQPTATQWFVIAIDIIQSSTCAASAWKCGTAYMTRQ